MKSEVKTLLGAYESVRNLSKFYISNLDKEKVHVRYEINGVKLNSAYWLVAHLTWTEHYLIVQGIGNKDLNIPWLEEYGYGTNPDEIKTKPDFDEVLKLFDEVHSKAVEILNSTTDEQLDELNHIDLSFGDKADIRTLLTHVIRHEPMHIGQISWILKMGNPEKTP